MLIEIKNDSDKPFRDYSLSNITQMIRSALNSYDSNWSDNIIFHALGQNGQSKMVIKIEEREEKEYMIIYIGEGSDICH